MPKFSAYMRGGQGPQGDPGQAALMDGIIDETQGENLPPLSVQKNQVYYVIKKDGTYLYVSLSSSDEWENLGNVNLSFSTYQPTTVNTVNWNQNASVLIQPISTTSAEKSFNWIFNIPHGRPAGFSTSQSTTVVPLPSNSTPYVIVEDTNTPFYEKQFKFNFGIPVGVAAGFNPNINTTVHSISYTSSPQVTVTVDPNSPETAKKFSFDFSIPKGEPAGFGVLSTSLNWLNHLAQPYFSISSSGTNIAKNIQFQLGIPEPHYAGFGTISVTSKSITWNTPIKASISTSGENWEKNFDFSFEIPQGRPAGFANQHNVSVSTLSPNSQAEVTIDPDDSTPDYAKKFNFHFGIPHGEAANFGEPTISVESLSSLSQPTATINATGGATTKVFNFHFGIPRGQKGETGDALAIYDSISFTTGSPIWNNNELHIQRGDNKKIPLFIYNENNLNIASTFELTENEIIYDADEKFNGEIYLVSETNKTSVRVNSVTAIPYSEIGDPNSLITTNIESTTSDVLLDFKIPCGPVGGTDDTGWVKIPQSNTNNLVYCRKIGSFASVWIQYQLDTTISSYSNRQIISNIPTTYFNRQELNEDVINRFPLTCKVLRNISNSSQNKDISLGCEILQTASNQSPSISISSGENEIPAGSVILISGVYLI